MRRSRFFACLLAVAALASPLLGGDVRYENEVLSGLDAQIEPAPAVSGPPAIALLAAGLALGLARGKPGIRGVRRPVRRRRG
jgi:hypothetical protein